MLAPSMVHLTHGEPTHMTKQTVHTQQVFVPFLSDRQTKLSGPAKPGITLNISLQTGTYLFRVLLTVRYPNFNNRAVIL